MYRDAVFNFVFIAFYVSQLFLTFLQRKQSASLIVPEEKFHFIDNLYCISSIDFTFQKVKTKPLAWM
jgi:hypothetical protein